MQPRPSSNPFAMLLLVLFTLWPIPSLLAATSADVGEEVVGAWQADDGSQLSMEADRILVFEGDFLMVASNLGREPGTITVRFDGMRETWTAQVLEGVLRLTRKGTTKEYRRLQEIPHHFDLTPFEIADPKVLGPERVRAIQAELAERRKRDQAVRLDPEQREKMRAIDAENVVYLKGLLRDVGWIDPVRFGPQTSVAAFLILQHSGDLPLMIGAMPLIEKDFKSSPDFAQLYTLLYDRLALWLGQKQKYGTQLGQDAEGKPMVLPLQDPDKVDTYLKELGLPPLANYLADASKYLYEGKPIRMPRPDE